MNRRRVLAACSFALAGCITGRTGQPATGDPEPRPPEPTPEPTDTPSPTPTVTPSPTASPTSIEANTPPSTPPPTRRPTVTAEIRLSERDRDDVRRAIVAELNRRRESPVANEGTYGETMTAMAQAHSEYMATQYLVGSRIGDGSPKSRYEKNDIHCAIDRPEKIGRVKHNRLEAVAAVDVRGALPEGVARTAVDTWWTDEEARWTLTLPGATAIGVGVALADDLAYLTVDLCG